MESTNTGAEPENGYLCLNRTGKVKNRVMEKVLACH
jgi:hypothetical protein